MYTLILVSYTKTYLKIYNTPLYEYLVAFILYVSQEHVWSFNDTAKKAWEIYVPSRQHINLNTISTNNLKFEHLQHLE